MLWCNFLFWTFVTITVSNNYYSWDAPGLMLYIDYASSSEILPNWWNDIQWEIKSSSCLQVLIKSCWVCEFSINFDKALDLACTSKCSWDKTRQRGLDEHPEWCVQAESGKPRQTELWLLISSTNITFRGRGVCVNFLHKDSTSKGGFSSPKLLARFPFTERNSW